MQSRNTLLLVLIAGLLLGGYVYLRPMLIKPPDPKKPGAVAVKPKEKDKDKGEKKDKKDKPALSGAGVTPAAPVPPGGKGTDLVLGSQEGDSGFDLEVTLDPRGASVRRIVAQRYEKADEWGRPTGEPLELIS